ncbi:MAG: hypothetical protein KQH63_19230 [Desulfobulbaceae bacterium]|nr:hypothetical protein [Desulfobulbaceae bacterium]
MMTLNELKNNRDILNEIDWNMTPEKAVDMYLEWGAGWTRGNDFVSGNDQSIYFVLFDWETPPQVTLLKRSMKEVVELAKIPVPADLFYEACAEDGYRPGGTVHSLNDKLKKWLGTVIGGPPTDFSITH